LWFHSLYKNFVKTSKVHVQSMVARSFMRWVSAIPDDLNRDGCYAAIDYSYVFGRKLPLDSYLDVRIIKPESGLHLPLEV
jgi:hypothetical protein